MYIIVIKNNSIIFKANISKFVNREYVENEYPLNKGFIHKWIEQEKDYLFEVHIKNILNINKPVFNSLTEDEQKNIINLKITALEQEKRNTIQRISQQYIQYKINILKEYLK